MNRLWSDSLAGTKRFLSALPVFGLWSNEIITHRLCADPVDGDLNRDDRRYANLRAKHQQVLYLVKEFNEMLLRAALQTDISKLINLFKLLSSRPRNFPEISSKTWIVGSRKFIYRAGLHPLRFAKPFQKLKLLLAQLLRRWKDSITYHISRYVLITTIYQRDEAKSSIAEKLARIESSGWRDDKNTPKSEASANESCGRQQKPFLHDIPEQRKSSSIILRRRLFLHVLFKQQHFAIMKSFCARLWNGENREFMQFSRWLFAADVLLFSSFCGGPFPSAKPPRNARKGHFATCFRKGGSARSSPRPECVFVLRQTLINPILAVAIAPSRSPQTASINGQSFLHAAPLHHHHQAWCDNQLQNLPSDLIWLFRVPIARCAVFVADLMMMTVVFMMHRAEPYISIGRSERDKLHKSYSFHYRNVAAQ